MKQEARCGNCLNWEKWPTSEVRGECQRLTISFYDREQPDDECIVYDDSIPITTGIHFGCIHFTPPTPEKQ